MIYMTQFLFYAIPISAVIFFAASLILYLSAKKKNRLEPGSVSEQKLDILKLLLIISSIIVGVLVAIVIVFSVMMYMAVAFM